jgi:hypothetical protein
VALELRDILHLQDLMVETVYLTVILHSVEQDQALGVMPVQNLAAAAQAE